MLKNDKLNINGVYLTALISVSTILSLSLFPVSGTGQPRPWGCLNPNWKGSGFEFKYLHSKYRQLRARSKITIHPIFYLGHGMSSNSHFKSFWINASEISGDPKRFSCWDPLVEVQWGPGSPNTLITSSKKWDEQHFSLHSVHPHSFHISSLWNRQLSMHIFISSLL